MQGFNLWGWEWCTVGPRGEKAEFRPGTLSAVWAESAAKFVGSCLEPWALSGLSGVDFVQMFGR